MAKKNMKLTAFLFHHRCRCTMEWGIKTVQEKMVREFTGQKKLKENCKDPKCCLMLAGLTWQE